MRCYVGRSWKFHHTRPPNGASLTPKWPSRDRRDSGVSAAVRGGAESAIMPDPPQGLPIPPTTQAGGTRVSALVCGEEPEVHSYPTHPTGRPYPPSGGIKTGATCVYPPLCGEELEPRSYTAPSWGVPISQTARAGPEGLGSLRRCVGRS